MPQSENGTRIQNEVGLHKSAEMLDNFDTFDRSPVVRESLELAAAQLAIGLMMPYSGTMDTVHERITEHMSESNSPTFAVEQLLHDGERDLLPAARAVIGLTFLAAKVSVARKSRRRL